MYVNTQHNLIDDNHDNDDEIDQSIHWGEKMNGSQQQ